MTNKETNELPEAPASATLSVITPKGFNTLFTVRDMSVNELVKKIAIIEEKLDELGYKPQIKGFVKKEVEYVEGKTCLKDGGKLKKIISKKDGTEYWGCANSTFIGGVKGGCSGFWTPEKYEQEKIVKETPDNSNKENVQGFDITEDVPF